jgi:hypothetical protein
VSLVVVYNREDAAQSRINGAKVLNNFREIIRYFYDQKFVVGHSC